MKKSLRRLAVVLLLSLPIAVFGQGRLQIDGAVTTEGGPLGTDVSIELRRGNEVIATGSTDPDGRFRLSFSAIGDDVYQVRFQSTTFGTRTLEVDQRRRDASLTEPGGLTIRLRLARPAAAAPGPRPRPMPPPPPPPPTSFPTIPQSAPTPPTGDNHAIVKVFYATDRARSTTAAQIEYGAARNAAGKLHLGRFDVSVPRDHRMATIERPTVWTFWREDPDKHFIIVGRTQQTYEQFYREIGGLVAQSPGKSVFVFVHGYNVTFESAVYRTAQLAYDLGFAGAPILYSWPSEGTEIGYPVDANNSQWSAAHLRWFLEDVSAKTGAQKIHLIAHSMGNHPLVRALSEISSAPRTGAAPRFSQIVLTAPDIDADTFGQLAGAIGRTGERITLYASSGDLALKISKKYQGYQRAGDSLPHIVVFGGIDTIDVSALDTGLVGHSYYGDNLSVLSDLFRLIKDGLAPSARPGLHETGTPPQRWWVFSP